MFNVSIKRGILASALERTFSVAGKSANMGILTSVYCEAKDGYLRFIGSDAELTVVSDVREVEIQEEGVVLFPAKTKEIVRMLEDADVEITADADQLRFACASWHGQIRLERDEYPKISTHFAAQLSIPKEDVLRALRRVRPAVPQDITRTSYQFVQITGHHARATDGSKFHQVDFPHDLEMLLPARAAAEIYRRARVMALDRIELAEVGRTYQFKFDDDLLIINKWNVEYPDVENALLIPALRNDQEIQLDRRAVIEAVRRVSQTADLDTNYMTMTFENDTLELLTLDKYSSTSTETMDVYWKGEKRQLGVNWSHLLDVLNAMSEPTATLRLGSDGDQGQLSLLVFVEEGFLGVLLQMRTDLGEAAKGSDRVRPAQAEPAGWGIHGMRASELVARNKDGEEVEAEEEEREDYLANDGSFDFNALVSTERRSSG